MEKSGKELYKSKPETYTEESYEKRIKELEETITFANRQLEYLERGIDEVPTGTREKNIFRIKNGLIVEITRCNIWLQKIIEDIAISLVKPWVCCRD